jgi:hypothetical protein
LFKNRGYYITASLLKQAGLLTYLFVSIYLKWAHEMTFMDGNVSSDINTWYQVENEVFHMQIYAIFIFLIVVYSTKIKSFWNASMPDIISPCGMYILPDFWSKRKASDILLHLKFEAY